MSEKQVKFKGKQARLQKALEAVLSDSSGANLYELIYTTHVVLKADAGLIWREIVDVVEEVTGDDLTHLRPPTCPECNNGLNIHKQCVNALCSEGRKTRSEMFGHGKRKKT